MLLNYKPDHAIDSKGRKGDVCNSLHTGLKQVTTSE